MRRYPAWLSGAALAAAMSVAACGGDGSGTPTSPSPSPAPSPSPSATITISAQGVVSPKTLEVAAGTRVNFVNNDSRAHEMASNPHPAHTDCVEINQVGFLAAGQARMTGNLNIARTCGYHDHNQESNTNLQGTIVIR